MTNPFTASDTSLAPFEVEALPEDPAMPPNAPLTAWCAILQALQEAACLLDEELRVREWNAAMARLTGLSKEQARWQPLFSLFPKNFKQGLEEILRAAFAQAEAGALETARTWDGEIQQFYGRDVFMTFRYRLCVLATDSRAPLAMLTLREVRHERMLKKQFECREQLTLLGMLNASVAQELSGALDMICHKLDEILKTAGAAGLAHHLEELVPQVYRIGYLTNNIVSLGRDIAPQLVYLNPNEAIQEALGLLEQTQKRKIACVVALTPSLPLIAADPVLLQIVFQNVMKYALEAAGEDVVPRVHTAAASQGAGVFIHIEDRGPEPEEEMLANFFDPAHTAGRWGLAIGLGLLLSKKIVEAHHGTFEVSSRPGAGTRLSIFLPAAGRGGI